MCTALRHADGQVRGTRHCRHGHTLHCLVRHGNDDPELGQPLCFDCYDYTSQVVWQWWAPDLWRRFTIALRRLIAKTLGVPGDRAAHVSTVQYATSAPMTPATSRFYDAVVNRSLSHSGDAQLAEHIGNCVIKDDSRGARLAKASKHSTRRIDAAVAAVMAFDRAAYLAESSGSRCSLLILIELSEQRLISINDHDC